MKIGGRYTRGKPLGVGGMGQIWEGTDDRLNRQVAIKVIRPGLPDRSAARRRFYREARILARLRHPGIPALYDFGAHDDELFIVMELVPGAVSLRDLIAERGDDPLPVPWAAVIGAQFCAALAAAHGAGLIHRDLTPSNIVLAPDGTVRILDFGVATALDPAEFSAITRPGEAPGSARYIAPELDGYAAADARADLYSAGCVLHELLTGRHPAERPAGFRDDLPGPLAHVIDTLLAEDPSTRPTSAADVVHALLPHARDLPPLPGYYTPTPNDPTHLYTKALSALPT
ncbi:serine/threonine-protein kinase [Actinomadura welshii]|uniref:serine/threonine-protein kinase n=1 Tax=Actinomadura welshii TaxID=3103817 RepID=UPI0003AD6726|nr:serine/threonine-protein kinase [Actinomadura madurae]